MTSRRQQIGNYYGHRGTLASRALASVLAPTSDYSFRGDRVEVAIVVRVDINGYSSWARERPIPQRAVLLDDFFTQLVPMAESLGGVYFRDEGDCLICLFSPYFGLYDSQRALQFCKGAAVGRFGPDRLTAKVSVAASDAVFFQKAHEVGTDDWSVEGDAFVRASRLEQAIPSKPRVYIFATEYERLFAPRAPTVPLGQKYYWSVEYENLQVPGLSLPGAWTQVVCLEHIPEGRNQE